MKNERLKGSVDLMLLAVLVDGPAHGYAVIERLRERSNGSFDLPEGTIYPALHRLEETGLLRSRWSDATGRRRRTYQLTAAGTRARWAHETEWRAFSTGLDALLGWSA